MLKPGATPSSQNIGATKDDNAHNATVGETIEKSVTGDDAPMEYEHPTSPGAVVWFTYPAVLIVVLLIGIAVMAWWNSAAQSVAP